MDTAVGYVRVSSRAQDYASQRAAIEQAASARGVTISTWYAETASARTISRPELERLRADARRGLVKRLFLFRLDRLSRSGIRDTFEVIEEFRAHGVEVVSVSDGFALDGPAAEVVVAVLSWAARMERLAINERIAAARERLAAEGRPWGRPSSLTRQDLARILALREAGRTIREIAIAMKVPRSTVASALSRNVGPFPPSSEPRLAHPKQGASTKYATRTRGKR